MSKKVTDKQIVGVIKSLYHWKWLVKNPSCTKRDYPPISKKGITNYCYCCNVFDDGCNLCPLSPKEPTSCADGLYDGWLHAKTIRSRVWFAKQIVNILENYLEDYINETPIN